MKLCFTPLRKKSGSILAYESKKLATENLGVYKLAKKMFDH